MKRFFAYGEHLTSTLDLEPFLPPAKGPGASTRLRGGDVEDPESLDAVFSLEVHGRRVRGYCASASGMFDRAQYWHVEVAEVCRFAWRDGETELVVKRETGVGSERVVFWFLHIVLPFYLSRRPSLLFLHAGAVAHEGRAMAFMAPTGTGKSSLVAACLERGLELVTDDKLAIQIDEAPVRALPSHPHCRDYRAQEDLGRRVSLFSQNALPLAGLCVVSRDPGLGKPGLEALTGVRRFQAALPSLLYHFSGDVLNPARDLARLVDQVPTYALVMPDDVRSIAKARDMVLAELLRGEAPQFRRSPAR